jgi:hypothetical protein
MVALLRYLATSWRMVIDGLGAFRVRVGNCNSDALPWYSMSSLAELPDLVGFFSYSRRDDEHSQGALTRLRAQIYNELRMQLGINFKLWQDSTAIPEGVLWEGEIKKAISEAVFFIPIVSPSSMASKHCRMEFEAFLEREAALGRTNLVFPLLYIRVPALEKEEQWRNDPVLNVVGARQYVDWQRFRHRSLADAEVAEKVEQYCRNIVEALQQHWISPEQRLLLEETEALRKTQLQEEEKKRLAVAAVEARRKAEQRRHIEEELQRRQAQKEERARLAAEAAEKHLVAARSAEQLQRDEEEHSRRRKEELEALIAGSRQFRRQREEDEIGDTQAGQQEAPRTTSLTGLMVLMGIVATLVIIAMLHRALAS